MQDYDIVYKLIASPSLYMAENNEKFVKIFETDIMKITDNRVYFNGNNRMFVSKYDINFMTNHGDACLEIYGLNKENLIQKAREWHNDKLEYHRTMVKYQEDLIEIFEKKVRDII